MEPATVTSARSRSIPSPATAYAAIGFTTLFWGLNFTFAKVAVGEIEPFAVALARVLIATPLFFAALARSGGPLLPSRAELKAALPLGLTGVLANQVFFISGIRRTTPAHAALVVALLPIAVLILAGILLKERLTPLKVAGVLVALSGVALISLKDGWTFSRETLTGDLLTLCGVSAFAYYTVAGKKIIPALGVLRATSLSFLTGGVLMIPIVLPVALRQDWGAVSARGWLALGYVVFVATFVCYLLYYWALAGIESGKVAAFNYLQPVIAGFASYLILGEAIHGHFVLGGLAILLGVYVAERG
jgi:drug/metabolite transporter (DMT)-like permease